MSATRQRTNPMIPSYDGGKFPLTTYLASQVREILADPKRWAKLPDAGLRVAADPAGAVAAAAARRSCWSRRFRAATASTWSPTRSRAGSRTRRSACCSPAGWSARGARPLGFVATDYSLAVWGLRDLGALFERGKPSLAELFDEDMLGDDLEAWLADSYLLKRTFRNCAIISGLIERRHPGRGEDRPAGHRLDRPRLRRAAQRTSPTTSCCRRRAPTRRPGLLDISGSAKCSFA